MFGLVNPLKSAEKLNKLLFILLHYLGSHSLMDHPWSGQHLGLEIDADEQTILKYILEYVLNCSSQMKSKSMGLFLNKSMI